MEKLTIALGSDHGGYNLKEAVKAHLLAKGSGAGPRGRDLEIKDFGVYSLDSADYPVIAKEVANAVAAGKFERGILVCGTGIGVSIVANKVKGIRAAVVENTFSAHATREHNDSNILCLGERVLGIGLALDIVDIWLKTEFEGGRHQKRLDMFE